MKNTDIEKLKNDLDIIRVIEGEGIELKKSGKSYMGLCLFHEDKNPSLSVDPEKKLFHCFGCNASGDVIKFIQLKHNFNFKQALDYLVKKYTTHTHYYSTAPVKSKSTVPPNVNDIHTENLKIKHLNNITNIYHQTLLNSEQAQEYLKSRGITSVDLIKRFKIGYCTGNVINRLVDTSEEFKILKEAGIICENGNGKHYEHFKGYITFPFTDENNSTGEMYGRTIGNAKIIHKYLPGKHAGIFNRQAVTIFDNLYLCECVIDALSLMQMGYQNVTCSFGKGNVTEEMTELIAKRIKKLYICYDTDGEAAAGKTANIFTAKGVACERIKLPENIKDVNDFLTIQLKEDLSKEQIRKKFEALEKIPYVMEQNKDDELELLHDYHGILEYRIADRLYKVKKFKRNVMADLKIFLTVTREQTKYFGNIDLSGEKSRKYFAENARERLEVSAYDVMEDLEQLAILLDEMQEKEYLKSTGAEEEELFAKPYEITDERYAQAVKNLADKDYLTETLLEDMNYIQVVGEEENKILYAIAILSPKIAEQSIHILMTSISGAGKSHVQKWIVTFFPAEDVARISGTSQQVLFYMEKDALKGKALSIDEDEGLQKSKYAIRTMMSEGRLELWVTEKDANGKNRAVCKKNDGPCSILVSSTSLYSMDRETRSRMAVTFGDETPEQTKRVQEAQVFMRYTKEGRKRTKEIPVIQQKHQDMMYVLRSTKDIKVEYRTKKQLARVKLADDDIRSRRNCTIFMAVIEVIVKTRIYRKEIFNENGDRFVYVDDEDIDFGEKLMKKIFLNQTADLKGALLRFYLRIVEYVDSVRGDVPRNEHDFKGREIREYTKLSKTETNENLRELVELEYLVKVKARNGADTVYRLCDNDNNFAKNNN